MEKKLNKMIAVDTDTYKVIKQLALNEDKKIYEVIREAIKVYEQSKNI